MKRPLKRKIPTQNAGGRAGCRKRITAQVGTIPHQFAREEGFQQAYSLDMIDSLTHPLTHSPTHPLTHSPTHPLTHSPTHWHAHPLTDSPTHRLTDSPTHPPTGTLTHSLPPSLTHSLAKREEAQATPPATIASTLHFLKPGPPGDNLEYLLQEASPSVLGSPWSPSLTHFTWGLVIFLERLNEPPYMTCLPKRPENKRQTLPDPLHMDQSRLLALRTGNEVPHMLGLQGENRKGQGSQSKARPAANSGVPALAFYGISVLWLGVRPFRPKRVDV